MLCLGASIGYWQGDIKARGGCCLLLHSGGAVLPPLWLVLLMPLLARGRVQRLQLLLVRWRRWRWVASGGADAPLVGAIHRLLAGRHQGTALTLLLPGDGSCCCLATPLSCS